jgi:hypothetical protein
MIIRVNVKQKHIDLGLRDSCKHCPVNLAIRETLPAYWDVYVSGNGTISITHCESNAGSLFLPVYPLFTENPVETWIAEFDAGCRMTPVTFQFRHMETQPINNQLAIDLASIEEHKR